jgi:hypothetical protein
MEFREEFKGRQHVASSKKSVEGTPRRVVKGIQIAERCFGKRWAVAIGAMLYTLRPRNQAEMTAIIDFFAEDVHGKKTFSSSLHCPRFPSRLALHTFALPLENTSI